MKLKNFKDINYSVLIDNNNSSSEEEDRFENLSNMLFNTSEHNWKHKELKGENTRLMKKIKVIIATIITLSIVTTAIAIILIALKNRPSFILNGLELEDILFSKLISKEFNGTWTKINNSIIYKDTKNGAIYSYDVSNKKRSLLINTVDERITTAFYYEISADNRYILIARNYKMIFRHSFTALYDIIDLQNGEIIPLKINDNEEQHPLLFAKWSPVGSALLINFERNLYYKSNVRDATIYQLTNDKNPAIINGHPDWVYEEEIFSSNIAFAFNPSGTKLAFIQFDDTPVHVMHIPYYGTSGNLNFQYPLTRSIPYPKTGTANPFVRLFQIDLERLVQGDPTRMSVPVPSALNTEDHIITTIEWLTDDMLLSIWMNRIQNRAYFQVSTESSRYELFNMQSTTGWIDSITALKNEDGSQIALILPQKQGSDGDYRHLAILSTKNSPVTNKLIPLTSGNYVVQKCIFWNYDANTIFYIANQPQKSNVNHLYAIKAGKGEKPKCLTCNMYSDGIVQTYFSADFSSTGKYVAISYLGPSIPKTIIYQVAFNNNNIDLYLVIEWESNQQIRKYLSNKVLPIIEHYTIEIDNGFKAKVLLQIPPNIDRSGFTKYPMLVNVYAGPDDVSVNDKWIMHWGSYLSSNKSVIYAKIDGRGSGAAGDRMLHSIYKKLGTYEVFDQINVTRSLQNRFPFIDSTRTGIWGWSYGGYVSAMALARDDSKVFKCGVSVAPVTDWFFYDSIYSERYMDLPQNNPNGYINSRLSTLGSHFKNKMYLLIHGTLDDNVHYQQAMMLAKNLEHNDVMFKQISYTDENHFLEGVSLHLYHSLDKFFDECFQLTKI